MLSPPVASGPLRAEPGSAAEGKGHGSPDAFAAHLALLAALAEAVTVDDVVAACVGPLLAAAGASGGAVWRETDDLGIVCAAAAGSLEAAHGCSSLLGEPDAQTTVVSLGNDCGDGGIGTLVLRWDAGPPSATDRARAAALAKACGRAWQRVRRARADADELERLRATVARLTQLDRRKDAFVAMLAHELRNPLTPLRLALGAVRHESASAPDPRLLEVMERQTVVLTHLVDDLLDLSRIRTGKVELRRELVDVRSVVSRAIDGVRDFVAQRRHELVSSLPVAPPCVLGDAVRLEQAIVNLLTNAAKYTPAGGRISVAVEVSDDHVVVSVVDNGLGIERRLLPLIFDLFVRGDEGGAAQGRGGLGIGLTIVRDLVALHGGGVEADSAGPGQGSVFRVRLPRADEHATFAPARRGTPTPLPIALTDAGRPRRVLVIDDNADVTLTLAALLESWGHDVRVAHAGVPGIEAAAAFSPDLVLLDIGLPDIDGYEVARSIRDRLGATTRLVALTGYAQDVDRERSRRAGFDRYVVKPLPIETLSEIVG